MQQHWLPDELKEFWSLCPEEHRLLRNMKGANRLGFAVCLKFFRHEGRFPSEHSEVPEAVVDHLATSLEVSPSLFTSYILLARSNKRDRARIRAFLGFRVSGNDDLESAERYLAQCVSSENMADSGLLEELRQWFRERSLEPPVVRQLKRMIRNARHRAERAFFDRINNALPKCAKRYMDGLLSPDKASGDENARFHILTSDPGRPSLNTVLKELAKLATLDAVALPPDLFEGASARVLHMYRLRAGTESITELRQHPEAIRYTLVAAFCHERRAEIIDGLADVLIQLVYRIGVRDKGRYVTVFYAHQS